ncbi:MAG: LeuD/DmdB family oxidoreductase small subunit [Candidatus Jordarchaeum sp.]|uniref:LeuD/DmdB family oxidoreductase small subunit n=1 Tax=Candidatus Jordarchaeum sp. TaxID=2823881 RepID=UPI00404A3BAB
MNVIKGKVWKFGDNIDTDVISPSKYMEASMDEQVKHVMEAINPKFPREVKPGDIIVAGRNFGCGSSRETAPDLIKRLGVAAVVAESFARIFFRNSVAIGLAILECPKVSEAFEEGDTLELDLEKARVENLNKNTTLEGKPLSPDMLRVLEKGGITSLLKEIAQELQK